MNNNEGTSIDKKKALELAMNQIKKEYGSDSIKNEKKITVLHSTKEAQKIIEDKEHIFESKYKKDLNIDKERIRLEKSIIESKKREEKTRYREELGEKGYKKVMSLEQDLKDYMIAIIILIFIGTGLFAFYMLDEWSLKNLFYIVFIMFMMTFVATLYFFLGVGILTNIIKYIREIRNKV